MFLAAFLSIACSHFRYFPLGIGPKTGLMKWSKKGGTGKNENFHGNINRLVHGVARLSSQACDARLLQRVHRHNHDMDRKHGFASKHSTLWPWRERDANDAAEKCVAEVPFPKAGPRPKVSIGRPKSIAGRFRKQVGGRVGVG